MKNALKTFGNIAQASRRQAKVPLGIIALAAVIGFAMTGCENPSSVLTPPTPPTKVEYVIFDVNGGSGSPPSRIDIKDGQDYITLPGQGDMVAPEGKYFAGWRAETWGSSGTIKYEGDQIYISSLAIYGGDGDHGKIFALWYSYLTVSFDAGGGSGTPPSNIQIRQDVQSTTLPGQGTMTAPEGKFFNGWRYSNTFYRAGDTFTFPDGKSSITLTAQWAQKGVYIGGISFAGDVKNLTPYSSGGSNLYYLDNSGRSNLSTYMNNYTKASGGSAFYYAVHYALADLKKAESVFSNDNIKSVNLITFTDGNDNASFGASIDNPIEGKSGISSDVYASYIKQEIANRKISGTSINAYSIGIKGSDVTDDAAFMADLSNIASKGENVKMITDYSALTNTFNEIADNINPVVDRKTNFRMQTTRNNPGTIIRMTFDVTGNASADADSSTRYIEGTFGYSNGKYTLTNIRYSNGIASDSGTSIEGTESGNNMVTFLFSNITGYNPSTDVAKTKQWTKSSASSATWQINSEYSAEGSIDTNIQMDTMLVYLVLDSSTSLTDAQITQIRTAVTSFINYLYNKVTAYQ